jgi:hypothetical protein
MRNTAKIASEFSPRHYRAAGFWWGKLRVYREKNQQRKRPAAPGV